MQTPPSSLRLREREATRIEALGLIEELFDTSLRDHPEVRGAYWEAFQILDRTRERTFADLGTPIKKLCKRCKMKEVEYQDDDECAWCRERRQEEEGARE